MCFLTQPRSFSDVFEKMFAIFANILLNNEYYFQGETNIIFKYGECASQNIYSRNNEYNYNFKCNKNV